MAHAGRAFQSRTHTMRFLFPVVFQLFHQKQQFCTGTARLASGSQLVLFSVKTVSRKWATQPWHLCDNSIAGIINGTEDALQPWRHGWSWIGKADQPCMCKKKRLMELLQYWICSCGVRVSGGHLTNADNVHSANCSEENCSAWSKNPGSEILNFELFPNKKMWAPPSQIQTCSLPSMCTIFHQKNLLEMTYGFCGNCLSGSLKMNQTNKQI